jgi:methionyl-tRNA formyltransferase
MTKSNPKIIFIGTSQFAVSVLEKLIKNKYNVSSVITAPDKPVGRKQEITPPPVKGIALKYNLPILQPEKISNFKSQISNLKPNLIIVAAYSQIIPKNILDIPKFGCLNLHPSLLPKYRGPSPIQTAILNGDKITGITIMLMDEKIDHGPIISQKRIALILQENSQTLEKKLAQTTADFLIETLPQYLQGKIKPQVQDESKATYTKILTRQDGQIDWQKSAQEIARKVRAFYPWPGAWTEFNGQRVKILKAKAVDKQQKETISTGKGFLSLEIVQPAGKKPMTGQEFFRGHKKTFSNN